MMALALAIRPGRQSGMLIPHPHFAGLSAFPLHRQMGIEYHAAEDGRSHISFRVLPEMLTPAPALHAGYLYTGCDLCSYIALMSLLAPEEAAVTHDIHVSVISSAQADDRVDIRAEVLRRGRSLAFMDVRAMAGNRLLATARVTKSFLRNKSAT
jgi:uncharacterized protein (TIGR00369 family)